PALNLRSSLANTIVLAVKAAVGHEGIVADSDYRGVPVLAALRAVPDSPWFLVARRDVAEVDAPLRAQLWQVIVMVSLLLFGAGAGVGIVWRQQRVRFYQKEAQSAEMLRESEQRHRSLFDQGNEGLIIMSLEGQLSEINRAFAEMHGYTVDELKSGNIRHLDVLNERTLTDRADLLPRIHAGEVVRFEVEHCHKDGHRFPLGVTTSLIHLGGQSFYMAYHQDITERKRAEAELRESEERYQRIAETITDYIYTVRVAAGRAAETTHGPGCLPVTGYQAQEFVNDPFLWFRMVLAEDRPKVEEQARQILAGESPPFLEHRIVRKNGTVRWVRNAFVPHRDEHGTLLSYDGLIQDITERKQAEAALRENRQRLEFALEGGELGSWDWCLQTGAVVYSERWAQLLEYQPGEVEPTVDFFKQHIHPEDMPAVLERLTGHVEGRLPVYDSEHRMRTKSGGWKWVSDHGKVATRDQDGRPVRITGVIADITARKRAEAERQKFVMLADSSSEFIGMCDLDLQPLYVNPAGLRMVGLPDLAAACQVKVPDYFFPEDQRLIAEEFFPRVLREGHGDVEIRLRHFQTGEPIWMFYYLFSVRDASGEIVGWATVSRDITERRQAEDALRQSRQAALNLMKDAVAARNRSEQMSQSLRESEERYHTLVETTFDWVWEVDAQDRYTYVSPRVWDMLGYRPEEVLGRTPFDLMPEDEARRVQALFAQIAARREPFAGLENTNRHRDGRLVVVETSGTPILSPEGTLLGYRGMDRDITERKQAEETLRESEMRVQRKLQSILSPEDNLGSLELSDIIDADAIQLLMEKFYILTRVPNSIIDLKGKVLVGTGWQDICTKFHRVHPETLKNCLECDTLMSKGVPPGAFKTYLCKNNLWDCVTPLLIGGQHVGNLFTGQFFFEGEKPDDSVFRAQAAKYGFDEEEYMAAVRRIPVWDRETINVAFDFYLALSSMMTSLSHSNLALARLLEQHKQAESEIRELNRSLEQRVVERTAELQAANQELDAFAYAVSHDLRQPLRAMNGFSQALVEDFGAALPGAAHEFLNHIIQASQRMGELIDGLLRLSRSTRGELRRDAVDISTLAARLLGELTAAEPERRVAWTVASGLTARGDEHMIEVVLANLLGNAWKYTARQPVAKIEVGVMDQCCDGVAAPAQNANTPILHHSNTPVFFVRDNGAGFDMKHAAKLFQPFQRLHREDEFPGIGIGLATVQRIVYRHGGTIRATAAPGQGATFSFSLSASDDKNKEQQL
ncbi:MAG: PAS domain S-box protein, partial [Verrucomicrobiota bacterium]